MRCDEKLNGKPNPLFYCAVTKRAQVLADEYGEAFLASLASEDNNVLVFGGPAGSRGDGGRAGIPETEFAAAIISKIRLFFLESDGEVVSHASCDVKGAEAPRSQ